MRRILLALALAACSRAPVPESSSGQTAPAQSPAAAQAEADAIFKLRCTPCHGPNGEGNGPAAASLVPHPRNFHDKAWQAQVADGEIEKAIQMGGAAVGKSPNMPPNPDLRDKPALVSALRQKVRAFGR